MIGYIILGVVIVIIILVVFFYIKAKSTGKINLNLNKFDFAAGETISGKLDLSLKKPVQSNGLNIKLVGIRKNSGNSLIGQKKNSSSSETIFNLEKQIDGQKIYSVGENSYNFEFKIPENIKQMTGNQIVDSLIKTAQFVVGQRIDWYLVAYLDISGFDISKKIKIYIN